MLKFSNSRIFKTTKTIIRHYSRNKKRKKNGNMVESSFDTSTGPKLRVPGRRNRKGGASPAAAVTSGSSEVTQELIKMYETKLQEAGERIQLLESEMQQFASLLSEMDLQNENDLLEQGIPEIVQPGHPALMSVSSPISKDQINEKTLLEFAETMKKAVVFYGGWGLAAPQIGSAIRMIVVNKSTVTAHINAEAERDEALSEAESLADLVGTDTDAGRKVTEAQNNADETSKLALRAQQELEAMKARTHSKTEIVAAEARAAATAKKAMKAKAEFVAAALGATKESKPVYDGRLLEGGDNSDVAVAEGDLDLLVIVNPTLEVLDGPTVARTEACLSIPGYHALVERPDNVRVTGVTPEGKPVDWTASGWHACVLQHEVDHLDGVLYVDKMVKGSFAMNPDGQEEDEDFDTIDEEDERMIEHQE
eukprot:g2586.t1